MEGAANGDEKEIRQCGESGDLIHGRKNRA
jgi:hypothetical protein